MGMRLFVGSFCALVATGCGGGSSGSPERPDPNTAPLAVSDSARTRPAVAVDIDVLANDSDADGDALTVEAPTTTATATIAVLASGALRVMPAAGFSGAIEFTYRARDSRGAFSVPTAVTVAVGPVARVLASTYSASPADAARIFISGAATTDYLELATLGPCRGAGSAVIFANGSTYIGLRCVSATRSEVFVVAPRASPLRAPVVLLGNVALARGIVVASNSERVIVAERVTNPDDTSVPGTYELVSVDVATRTVAQRLPLTGIDNVSSIQYAGGVAGRVLIVSGTDIAEEALYVADMAAGTVQHIADLSFAWFSPFYSMVSPDGRFIVDRLPFSGNIDGLDVQNPGQMMTLWTPPAASTFDVIGGTQFAQAPGATLLVTLRNASTAQSAIWSVPLDAPLNARELTRYPDASPPLLVLVRGDLLVHGAAAADPLATDIHLVRVSTGEQLGALSPPGGLRGVDRLEGFNGNLLLFTVIDDQQRRRAALIRRDAPGIIQWIAPNHELAPFTPVLIDQAETAIGFTAIEAGVHLPYIVDVNLLTSPVKVSAGIAAGAQTALSLVLGPPGP
jgi:hypothetical protein